MTDKTTLDRSQAMTEPTLRDRCVATRATLNGGVHQCRKPATHGEWCRMHAQSLGGWVLVPPAATPPAHSITHGRHCPCSACGRQDWSDPALAPCGMHGPSCPPVYTPGVAATPPALDANDWRELFARCGQKWAALLERYDLAEDATPEDIIRVAERRGAWDALARQGLRPPRPPKPSANREWDGS